MRSILLAVIVNAALAGCDLLSDQRVLNAQPDRENEKTAPFVPSAPIAPSNMLSVVWVDPSPGTDNVPVSEQLAILFSAPIDSGSITGSLTLMSGDLPTGIREWRRPATAEYVSGTLAIPDSNASAIVFTPDSPLAWDTRYTATLHAGGIRDTAGNVLQADHAWSFTTEKNPARPWTMPEEITTLDHIAAGGNGSVYALGHGSQGMALARFDRNGELVWIRREREESGVWAMPFGMKVVGDRVFIGQNFPGRHFQCRSALDGSLIWKTGLDDGLVAVENSIVCDREGSIYAVFREGWRDGWCDEETWCGWWYGGSIVKVSPDGAVLWKKELIRESGVLDAVAVDDSLNVFIAGSLWSPETGDKGSFIRKYDHGWNVQWERCVPSSSGKGSLAFSPSQHVVYAAGAGSVLRALDSASGSTVWEHNIKASSLVVDGAGFIYSFGVKVAPSGNVAWSNRPPAVVHSFAVGSEAVFTVSGWNGINRFSLETGNSLP